MAQSKLRVTASACVSADGYLDDASPQRCVLSSPQDLADVYRLRAHADAILVGAQTIRRDGCALMPRSAQEKELRASNGLTDQPAKITVTATGNIPGDSPFFQAGDGLKIVLSSAPPKCTAHLSGLARIVPFQGHWWAACKALLSEEKLNHLLVEGGAHILAGVLPSGDVDAFRLARAPDVLGGNGYARLPWADCGALVEELSFGASDPLAFGDTHVVWYYGARQMEAWGALMERATDLSWRAPLSDSAFRVGAIGVDHHGGVIAYGWSRARAHNDHAEEVMLANLADKERLHTCITTLEPCFHRASKPTGCADLLIKAGVRQVIYGAREPAVFVQQEGIARLNRAGIITVHLPQFQAAFEQINAAFLA